MGTIPKTNPNAGPGSYRVVENMELSSEMPAHPGIKFPTSERPDMNMKTLGPGPIYELEGKFRYGKDSKVLPGFNLDHRKPLVESATDAMYHPPLSKGTSVTIKQRRVPSVLRAHQMRNSPAPHDYDVVGAARRLNREPSYSFGRGAERFPGGDRITLMMRQLEDTEKMQKFMGDLPSVSTASGSRPSVRGH